MLDIQDLHGHYGDSHIVQGVSLKIGEGERVALIGRNGVGKSTLLKSIMNAGPRVSGGVSWYGSDLGSMPAFRRARMGMSFVPEDRRILPGVTVFENLQMAQRGLGKDREPRDAREVLNSFPMLIPLEERHGDRLSGGQQQMLAVARSIVTAPRLMLLDEPTEGLAPVIVEELAQSVVETCRAADTALLLCEQNLWFARKCTDYVYVLDSGRIVFSGTWEEFEADKSVRERYLAV